MVPKLECLVVELDWSSICGFCPAAVDVHIYLCYGPVTKDSTGFWPPGSLYTLGADGHI